jgi:HEAT repeat protein
LRASSLARKEKLMSGRCVLGAFAGALMVAALMGIAYYAGRGPEGGARESAREVVEQRLASLDGIEARLKKLEDEIASLRSAMAASASGEAAAPAADADGSRTGMEASLSTLQERIKGLEEDPVRRGYSYLASENAELRRQGINILDRVARFDPEARAAIRELLKDPSPRVREQAAQKLMDLRDKESLPEMKVLLADSDARTRRRAVQALGAMGAKDAARDIGRNLVSDPDDQVRQTSADVLGRLRSREAEESLVEALKDKNEVVRGEAIASLGEIGATTAVPQLRVLYDQGAGEHRLRLALALKSLGDEAPLRQEAGRLSDLALSSPEEGVRLQAIRDLAVLARDTSQEVFTQALKDPSPTVRREAERALK